MEFVGKSVPRVDAFNKVTGRHEFAIEDRMPGMLCGRLLRSPSAHARIKAVDVAAALRIPGVVSVLSAADLPRPMPLFGAFVADQPLLADGETRFHGEPVAVALAEDDGAALAAVAAVRLDCEDLPAVTNVAAAIAPGAPLVHAEGTTGSNIQNEFKYGWGDVDAAERQCVKVYENVYTFPKIHQFALEPFSVIAYPDNGGVTIRSPNQSPFQLRRVVANCLGLELSRIRVVASSIGGGFGSRAYAKYEPLAAYLALRVGRPVKIMTSLDEAFFTARRTSATVWMRTGFDRDGKIALHDVKVDYLMGAYCDAGPLIFKKAAWLSCGPYRIPTVRCRSRAIHSHTTPATAMRGYGMPQLNFALETQMQFAAKDLGIDPVEIRMRNLAKKGEILVPGDTPSDGDWREGLCRVADMIGWNEPRAPGEGCGIAIGIKNPATAAVSNALVKFHPDNSLTVAVGSTEMGQGARTVFAQVAAESLGVPPERIHVIMGDTAAVPFDTSTTSSRSTVTTGNAVVSACKNLSLQFENMARELGLIDPNDKAEIKGGVVTAGQNRLSFHEIFTRYYSRMAGEVVGRGTFKDVVVPSLPLGGPASFWEVVFIAARVNIDSATGKVRVTKVATCTDVGKAINPLHCKAQEEGGVVQGLGHALMEQMIYDSDGHLANGGPLDYRIPTIMDAPWEMDSSLVENEDGPGPFGAKGIGESGCIAAGTAVANAIADATGYTFTQLPITAERVWAALSGAGASQQST